MAENIRYFMFKYDFSIQDWYKPLSFILQKIDSYLCIRSGNIHDRCTATAINDLCSERDNCMYNYRQDINDIIHNLCTD